MTILASAVIAQIETLESPYQRAAAMFHVEQGDIASALVVMSMPARLYAAHDRAMIIAFLLGMAEASKD